MVMQGEFVMKKHRTHVFSYSFWGIFAIMALSQAVFSQVGRQQFDDAEPLFSENGLIKSHVLFNIYFESFHKMTLQEADHFNGNTFFANILIPISHSTQFRIELPYYTEGNAVLKKAGDAPGEVVGAPTHLKGYNGVFNLYSILIEHQFRSMDKNGFNFLGFFGGGYRLDPIETTFKDKYNHAGLTAITGFRVDGNLSRNVHLLANSKLTFFMISDDVGPSDKGWDWITGADGWFLGNLSGAVMLPKFSGFTPIAESRFMTDFHQYNTFYAGPSLVLSLKSVDLKAGVLIGVNNDAEDYRSKFDITIKTF